MLDMEITERQLLDQFLEALRELPDVQVELGLRQQYEGPDRGYDACVDLWVSGKPVTLQIEVKKSLYPRDVRQNLWQLEDYASRRPQSEKGGQTSYCLVAESISPGAKHLMRDKRVGYYDSGGSMFLPAKDIYVYVDKPPPKTLSRTIRSLFSGRRSRVLHALLMRPGEWIGVKELAELAFVSPATASQVLKELERFDWVDTRGLGPTKKRFLREPGALLDEWTKQLELMRPPVIKRYYVPSVHVEGLLLKFDKVCDKYKAEYAITHEAAAQWYAPFLSTFSQVRCRMVVGGPADAVLEELDAHKVNHGANLTVIAVKSSDELLFREHKHGTWLASPVQVYLDLIQSEGRAKEMAEHLRKVWIELQW